MGFPVSSPPGRSTQLYAFSGIDPGRARMRHYSLSFASQPQSISIQNALLMGGVQTSKNVVNAMSLPIHLRCCPSDIPLFRDARLLETTELFCHLSPGLHSLDRFDPSPVPRVHPEASPRRRRPRTQCGINYVVAELLWYPRPLGKPGWWVVVVSHDRPLQQLASRRPRHHLG